MLFRLPKHTQLLSRLFRPSCQMCPTTQRAQTKTSAPLSKQHRQSTRKCGWTLSPFTPPLPMFFSKPCHCRCAPSFNSGAFVSQTLFLLTCLCGLLTTMVRRGQRTVKQSGHLASCQRLQHTPPPPLHQRGICRMHQADHDIFDIGLRVIQWCGMYAIKYKEWIAREAIHLRIVKTFDSL
jgi:hypothetical protein